MKGRRVGSIELSFEQINLIKKFTLDGYSRTHIAIMVGCGHDTVWRYQKKMGLI